MLQIPLTPDFERIRAPENLHDRVTRALALRVIEAGHASERILFPNEAGLCHQLGVSRSILREAVKVLADKGMVEVRPRSGTRSRPRAEWNLLDPDILAWQAEVHPDVQFLRDLCEVRLAIEPTAAGFAAIRATEEEIGAIERSLGEREAKAKTARPGEIIDLDLSFHAAVVDASHNALLRQLSTVIRRPLRTALSYTSKFPSAARLGLEAHRRLLESLRKRDPMAARHAAEEAVGMAMLAVEKVIRAQEIRNRVTG